MYVLMDLEWFRDEDNTCIPTQIAALRTDGEWRGQDMFFARFRINGENFDNWDHMAFSGGKPEDFMNADPPENIWARLEAWFQKDDLLCWWGDQAPMLFRRLYARHLYAPDTPVTPEAAFAGMRGKIAPVKTDTKTDTNTKTETQTEAKTETDTGTDMAADADTAPNTAADAPPRRVLPPMRMFLRWGITGKNPYKVAVKKELPVTLPLPAHCSENDVLAMQMVLQALAYKPTKMMFPSLKMAKEKKKPAPAPAPVPPPPPPPPPPPYLWDEQNGIVHKRGCENIPEGAELTPLKDLKPCFKQTAKPCPDCLEEEFRQIKRDRARDMIQRSTFQYIFSKDSQVFHTRDCTVMLSANSILGSSYKGCVKSGRRPCQICKPEPPPPPPQQERKEPAIPLPPAQQKAVDRLREAQKERRRAEFDQMTEQELQDHFTLTKPGNVFWAAAGHQTFHRRDCPKLKGLTELRGFAKFNAAVNAGFTPCSVCNPDRKMDVEYSIPISSHRRKGESPRDLAVLCRENNYVYRRIDDYFIIHTSVGRWRIHLNTRPVELDHINLAAPWGGKDKREFHRQPRLFLSLADTFAYIKRHDTNIMDSMKPKPAGKIQNSDGTSTDIPFRHLGPDDEDD